LLSSTGIPVSVRA
jgi:hypothetical protein